MNTPFGSIGDVAGADLIVGDEAIRAAAREQRRQEDRLRIAMRSGWPELRRSDLDVGSFDPLIEHVPSGALYRMTDCEIFEGGRDHIAAFYVTASGDVQLLEQPVDAPKTRQEWEARVARRLRQQQRRPSCEGIAMSYDRELREADRRSSQRPQSRLG